MGGQPFGSPINPIVANLFMYKFWIKALSKVANPQRLQRRYADDTFVVQMLAYKSRFFEHINLIDQGIQSIIEDTT